MNHPIDILSFTSAEFSAQAARRGVKAPAAMDIYRRAFRQGSTLVDWAAIHCSPVADTLLENGTTKFILRHPDHLETESVILPITSVNGRVRNTLCVSSQVGCAMGCTFCETAQMGFMKNLSASQILAQWHVANFLLPLPLGEGRGEGVQHGGDAQQDTHLDPSPECRRSLITNIVFMGMGEPMENLDAVIQAIRIFSDQNGPSIPAARISVSTVGRADGIARLAALARTEGFRKLRLAVSINAPNDEIRSMIMPINRSTPMAKLMTAMLQWPTSERSRVLIEYVVIPGVNDEPAHARQLCHYLRPLRCTVNVIPYNPRRNSPWPAPSEDCVRQFIQAVHDCGQFVKRRQTLGRGVMAACGQLGNPAIRARKPVSA